MCPERRAREQFIERQGPFAGAEEYGAIFGRAVCGHDICCWIFSAFLAAMSLSHSRCQRL